MSELTNLLRPIGQEHLLKYHSDLSYEHRTHLESQLRSLDWSMLDELSKKYVLNRFETGGETDHSINETLIDQFPPGSVSGPSTCSETDNAKYLDLGLKAMDQGKVAALLLSGGQGTRLGVDYPKGMYDVGLPSHKSLFQLQAERIASLNKIVSERTKNQSRSIIWYVMTSESTIGKTKKFFEDNNFFGLDAKWVVFFEQGTLPCFDFRGKILLDQKYKIATSPDGNGGLYEAIHRHHIIKHMIDNGIEFVHTYCVDNILVRVCDPIFMGYCISNQVDCGVKAVEKVSPSESVGVICKVNNKYKVIEYSEIPKNLAEKRDDNTGKLVYNLGNICEHFFDVRFLTSLGTDRQLDYHVAIKKIPHIDMNTGEYVKPSSPNGIKLEKFIFDVFEFADKLVVWRVNREDEFSPLKNADGSQKDNPTTARESLLRAYERGLLTV